MYRLQIEVQMPSASGINASAIVRASGGSDIEVHDTLEAEEVSRPVDLDAWHAALLELGIEEP